MCDRDIKIINKKQELSKGRKSSDYLAHACADLRLKHVDIVSSLQTDYSRLGFTPS